MNITNIEVTEFNFDKTAFAGQCLVDGVKKYITANKVSNALVLGTNISSLTDPNIGDANWSAIMRVFEGA